MPTSSNVCEAVEPHLFAESVEAKVTPFAVEVCTNRVAAVEGFVAMIVLRTPGIGSASV